MLTELRIRNFAIIESVNLPFAPGLNVLSGETGAGKSIIVGALGLLIGDRSASDQVRTGADRATIEGVFDLPAGSAVRALLDGRGIEVDDGPLVMKREIAAAGGRARAWINGTPVTAAVLSDIGRQLVNVHGQHDAQALLDVEAQRAILDLFAQASHALQATAAAWRARRDLHAQLVALIARRDDVRARADYLEHVAREVDDAALAAGEDERLADEAHRLAHAEEIRQLVATLQAGLDDGEEGTLQRLGHLQRTLAALLRVDASSARLQELYDAAYYAVEELSRTVSEYGEHTDLDPGRLEAIEQRRDLIARLSRKHGGGIDAVLKAGRVARAELEMLATAEFDLRELEVQRSLTERDLAAAAQALTALRRSAAKALASAVGAQLPDLGMPDGRFVVTLHTSKEVGEQGAEEVEFEVALNIGHDPRALSRVASGGELSRVMLALKVVLARLDQIPTLVFDEVDAGIGGAVGLMVGDAMRRVSQHHQVFAITHLAQIAARADHHIVVSKGARDGVTTADIAVVHGAARVEELARMLSGDAESALSREHASELLRGAVAARTDSAVDAPPQARQRPKSRR